MLLATCSPVSGGIRGHLVCVAHGCWQHFHPVGLEVNELSWVGPWHQYPLANSLWKPWIHFHHLSFVTATSLSYGMWVTSEAYVASFLVSFWSQIISEAFYNSVGYCKPHGSTPVLSPLIFCLFMLQRLESPFFCYTYSHEVILPLPFLWP